MIERDRLNKITETIIGAAIQVHRVLGPGLLESAYVACLAYEMRKRGLAVDEQKPVPLVYEEVRLDCGYRMDLLVEKSVVVEVKSIEALAPIHEAQTLSYLRLSGCKGLAHQLQRDGAQRRPPAVYKRKALKSRN
jgi:GxxExxY protein